MATLSENPILRRIAGKGLLNLAGTSGLLLGARILGVCCGLALMLMLARMLEPAVVGQITTALSVALLLSAFSTLNFNAGAMRFLTNALVRNDKAQAVGYIRTGQKLVIVSAAIIAIVVVLAYLVAQTSTDVRLATPSYLLLAILAAPLHGWIKLHASYLAADNRVLLAYLPDTLLRQAGLLLLSGIAIWLAGARDASTIIALLLVTLVLLALLQWFALAASVRSISNSEPPNYADRKRWIKFGLVMLLPQLFLEFSIDTIVVISAFVLTEADIAKLGIVLRINGLLMFAIAAVSMAFGPKIAASIHSNDKRATHELLVLSGQLKFWLGLGGCLFFVIAGKFMLGFFGAPYQDAYIALVILALQPLCLALAGPTVLAATNLNLERSSLTVFCFALVVLTCAIMIAGSLYGLNGVASAAVLAWGFWNIALQQIVRRQSGYDVSLFGNFLLRKVDTCD